jgi:hypothetical protein
MRSSILCGRLGRQNLQQSTGIDFMTSSTELLYMMYLSPPRDVFWIEVSSLLETSRDSDPPEDADGSYTDHWHALGYPSCWAVLHLAFETLRQSHILRTHSLGPPMTCQWPHTKIPTWWKHLDEADLDDFPGPSKYMIPQTVLERQFKQDTWWTMEHERTVFLSGKNHKEVLEADLMFYG